MRDDFGIEDVVTVKVALTATHVSDFQLQPNNLDNKRDGARYKGFVKRFGNEGYELEAMPPTDLQRILRGAIDSVIDVEKFNAEVDNEKRDAAHLDVVRRAVQAQLADMDFG